MKNIHRILALVIGASWGPPAAAATPPAAQQAEQPAAIAASAVSATAAMAPLPEPRAQSLGSAVSGDKLNAERGKADTVAYEARLGGVVAANSATNVATGANSIDTGSFANMAGLPVVIQNTGANVLIQNSTIVNVQFR